MDVKTVLNEVIKEHCPIIMHVANHYKTYLN